MTRTEGRMDDAAASLAERTIMFVLTLIVTTVIAAFAVYVLGSGVFDTGASAPHRAAIAVAHPHA
jgi:hypothetical protein